MVVSVVVSMVVSVVVVHAPMVSGSDLRAESRPARSETGLQDEEAGEDREQDRHGKDQEHQRACTETRMLIMRAAIYTRISEDSAGRGLGVGRQKRDCEEYAARKGWGVADYYTDNDVSATRSKVRPEYERMLADVRGRRVDIVVVYAMDRLTRSPAELESLIVMADEFGLELATVSGNIHIRTHEDRMMARLMGNLASYETAKMSDRLKRKFLEKAELGEPHGYSPYGYTRVQPVDSDGRRTSKIGRDVVHPEHGEVVREAARRTLAGESLRSIVADFNLRNIHGPKAAHWNSTILRQILLRPTNAGLRQYQGRVMGKSTTQPLYDEATYDRLVALLKDPARKSNFAGSSYKYLLSGLAICGLCGGPMRRQVGRTVVSTKTGNTKTRPPSYNCGLCFKVRRSQESVDHLIVELLIGRLSMDDAATVYRTGDSAKAIEAQASIEAIDTKLSLLSDDFANDVITHEQFKRTTGTLRLNRAAAERDLDGARPRTYLTALAGGEVRAKWLEMPIDAQREVVADLLTVTILPTGSGTRFDPDLVVVDWKTSGELKSAVDDAP
ncbi:recombinase family protein [Cryobacterium sp. 5B3]|uniref:recombinase family protein n=1 Tax=Cryobacterium sp. 5B3 TaxID=3048586 RepID=UPI002AB48298|nr:recombinase family protein [Cryobacterium sp. 5B3]MDY7540889.1 recombinase family protein [Cryobacterium sp. 5B3]MEB0275362.1 recombinase family protein [Cryobacterium sp. 5B3]